MSKHLAKEFDVEIGERHISRLLKSMGLSTRQKQINQGMGIAIHDLPSNQSSKPYYFLNLMSIS